MIVALLQRGERLAREYQRQTVQSVAEQLRGMFGDAAVEVEEQRVLVRGREIMKRWLTEPSLRFLGGALR